MSSPMSFASVVWLSLLSLTSAELSSVTSCFLYSSAISDLGFHWTHNKQRSSAHQTLVLQMPNVSFRSYYRESIPSAWVDPGAAPLAVRSMIAEHSCNFMACINFNSACEEAAPSYPDVWFANFFGDPATSPNVISYGHATHESVYLAGVSAGLTTQTGSLGYVIPFTGLFDIDVHAFLLGARSTYEKRAVSQTHPFAFHVVPLGSYEFPEGETRAAELLMEQKNVDVVAYYANTASVAAAARNAGRYTIGHNGDQSEFYGDVVLTSTSFQFTSFYAGIPEAMALGYLPSRANAGDPEWGNASSAVHQKLSSTAFDIVRRVTLSRMVFGGLKEGFTQTYDLSPVVSSNSEKRAAFAEEASKMVTGEPPCQRIFGTLYPNIATMPGCAGRIDTLAESIALRLLEGNATALRFAIPSVLPPGMSGNNSFVYPTIKLPSTCANNTVGVYENVSLVCVACERGYVSTEGMPCTECPAGSRAVSGYCVTCDVGFTATSASTECVACPGVDGYRCPEGSFKFPTWAIALVVLVLVVVVAVVVVLLWRVVSSRKKFDSLYGAVTLAETTAEAISTWRLEDVEYLRGLRKPNRLQHAFLRILTNLELYRPYIPQHLLSVESDESADDEVVSRKGSQRQGRRGRVLRSPSVKSGGSESAMSFDGPVHRRAASDGSGSSHGGSTRHSGLSSSRPHGTDVALRTALGLSPRLVTIVCVHVERHASSPLMTTTASTPTIRGGRSNPLTSADRKSCFASEHDFLSPIVEVVTNAMQVHARSASTVIGPDGSLYVTFVAGRVSNRESRAYDLSEAILAHAPPSMGVAIGIVTRVELCGNVGSNAMRSFVFPGPTLPLAAAMAETARASGARILCDEATTQQIPGSACAARAIVFAQVHARSLRETAFELLPRGKSSGGHGAASADAPEEWMYELAASAVPAESLATLETVNAFVTGQLAPGSAAVMDVPKLIPLREGTALSNSAPDTSMPSYSLEWFHVLREKPAIGYFYSHQTIAVRPMITFETPSGALSVATMSQSVTMETVAEGAGMSVLQVESMCD
eukprot:TRINITY_DN1283_c0_g1_i1.p1 TRINITY_DN1283_c0_g1~~TRINITY_DN1283_c0_g1_i1.p1  ORF type:complete len:1046 (-),score=176.83 TRINITY_DN1283_c0_g1_i1:581-3718(-)